MEGLGVESDRNVRFDGSQPFGQQAEFLVFLDLFAQGSAYLSRVRQQVFHRAVLGEKFLGRFFSYSRQPGDVVRRIAHHAQVIPHLQGIFHPETLLHPGNVPYLDAVAHPRRTVHEGSGGNQLGIVLVGGNHVGGKTLLFGFSGQGADHVVRFEAFAGELWDVESLQNVLDHRHGKLYRFGRRLPLGLVGIEQLVAEGGFGGVEYGRDMAGTLLAQQVEQGIDKPHYGRGVFAVAVGTHGFHEGEVSPVDQCVGVEQEKSFVFFGFHK